MFLSPITRLAKRNTKTNYNISMMDFYTNVSRKGKFLLIRGIKNGQEHRDRVCYSPIYYTNTPEETGFKTIYGDNLKPHRFDTMYDGKNFCDSRKGTNSPAYGFPNPKAQYTLENFKDSTDKYEKKFIRVWYLDIEVTSEEGFPDPKDAKYPITAITVYDSVNNIFVSYGLGDWDRGNASLPDIEEDIYYIKCQSEQQLLDKFLQYWRVHCPNIITGWNIETFDMPYIHNRITNLGMNPARMSPWEFTEIREIKTRQGLRYAVNISGVDILDYMPIYKKNKVKDSYKLDNVAFDELGEQKSLSTVAMLDVSRTPFTDQLSKNSYELVGDPEFDKFAKIRSKRLEMEVVPDILVEEERKSAHQAFITYNIQDTNLVKRLDEKLGLLDTRIMIAYEACINFEESESPVRVWDSLINKELYQNNIVPHYSSAGGESGGIPGGFVKEPKRGKHGWCLSFDLASLYPHLIMQYNISPETLDKDYSLWPKQPLMKPGSITLLMRLSLIRNQDIRILQLDTGSLISLRG